jgi:hypothetical protein
MRNLLYVLAAILVVAWVVGYYGTNAGNVIHILLVIAAVAVLIRVIRGQRVV